MFKPIFSFIVLVLSFSFAFLYVMPEYDRAKERRRDLENLSDISKTAEEIETLIGETEEILNSVDSDDRARFAVFLPETSDPVRLANNLQRVGLTNGIVLQDIKVEETVTEAQKSAKSNGSGALQAVANIFSVGGSVDQGKGSTEGGKAGAVTGEKKYATTKTSFSFATTHEAFSNFLFDTERSLGLINITALSFVPVPVVTDTKKSKQVVLQLYQYAVTVETYSLK